MQVLSLTTPGLEKFDASNGITLSKNTNNELSKVIKKYPHRFSGLAALPLQEPKIAADELERAVKELGLRGAKINHMLKGEFLDIKNIGLSSKKQRNLVCQYIFIRTYRRQTC